MKPTYASDIQHRNTKTKYEIKVNSQQSNNKIWIRNLTSKKFFWCFEMFKSSQFFVMLFNLGYSKENVKNAFRGKLHSYPESEKDIISKVINDEKSIYSVIKRSRKSKSMNSSKNFRLVFCLMYF